MRILVFVVYYLPSPIASAKLIHDLGGEFRRMGHDVVIAAPDENIPSESQITCEEGITVLRIKTGKIKTASRSVRAFNEVRLSQTMWKKGSQFFEANPFDLIVYYSPTIFFGSLVNRLKTLFGCPSYLILRDIFPQWAVDAGILRRGSIVYNFFKWKERRNYEAANVIGVQSPANLRYFTELGLDKKYNLEVLYNWTALTKYNTPEGKYRDRLGLENKVVFFYGGNIGLAQDMDNILRLAEALRNEPTAYFLLVGDGSEVPRLKRKIAEQNLTNIYIHPSIDQEEYLAMLSEFDVGLISLDRGLKTQNFPGKMLSYMYLAKPILASMNPGNDLKDILEEHRAGMVCINGEDDLLADCARRLMENQDLRRQLGCNGRALLENMFSVSKAARQILSHFAN
jgi:glycosyltransferase involved in cell wall biosynthesis